MEGLTLSLSIDWACTAIHSAGSWTSPPPSMYVRLIHWHDTAATLLTCGPAIASSIATILAAGFVSSPKAATYRWNCCASFGRHCPLALNFPAVSTPCCPLPFTPGTMSCLCWNGAVKLEVSHLFNYMFSATKKVCTSITGYMFIPDNQ